MIVPLGEDDAVYELDGRKAFSAASVTKIPTCLTALETLGPDYRFRTPVARYGEVEGDGVLHGDLVLEAVGDPNLSNRIVGDALAFSDIDHSQGDVAGALPVEGDPLAVLRSLAGKIYEAGIRRTCGLVRVNLCGSDEGERDLGSGLRISPICVNDNIVDVHVTPGQKGEKAALRFQPAAPIFEFVNETVTVAPEQPTTVRFVEDEDPSDPSVVRVRGNVPAGKPFWTCYGVPSPRRYAEALFRIALRDAGIALDDSSAAHAHADGARIEVASHTSPPLREAVKVVLKVSQNLHAELLVRASGGGLRDAGFRAVRELFERAGLDVSESAQARGAGGGYFSPATACRLLQYAARQSYASAFREALPVLGVDGTLHDIQRTSPAAGHVRAKTGTFGHRDELNSVHHLSAKALAGYIDAKSGRVYVFAAFANNIHASSATSANDIGELLGEIASAAREIL